MQILQDAEQRPRAFHWLGPVDRDAVEEWLAHHSFRATDELLQLWATVGGGEVFETEDILTPDDGQGGVLEVTRTHRAQGLATDIMVFHRGTWISAVDQLDLSIVVLDAETLAPLRSFADLDSWYVGTLRTEFGDRYDLPAL